MADIEYEKCPVCKGNPRRWLSYDECIRNCIHPGSYEDCTNCYDGYVPIDNQVCSCHFALNFKPRSGMCGTCGLPHQEEK